jgi:mono/diheme cytochrome c family protein
MAVVPSSPLVRSRLRRLYATASLLSVSAVLGLAGCHGEPALTPQQAEGQHLYEVRCAHCHRDNDLALKKIPPDLHGLFAHTTLPSGAPATDAEVQRVILAGKGTMPSFNGRFTDDQMAALLAYLHRGLR